MSRPSSQYLSSHWPRWQADIINVLRFDYGDLFPLIRADEIDWEAWRPLYNQGYTPRVAVEQAISGSFDRAAM